MLHPDTELRFVSKEIGYGIFATKDIPMGTLTWVRDELDRFYTPAEAQALSPSNYSNLMKYTYRDRHGNYFFCWDLTRYVNHSYQPNSMLTAMGFEIAIRTIKEGEEMTNDYGSFNLDDPFQCAKGPHERQFVLPDDIITYHKIWDAEIEEAMKEVLKVDQPLTPFLNSSQIRQIENIFNGKEKVPSVLENHYFK